MHKGVKRKRLCTVQTSSERPYLWLQCGPIIAYPMVWEISLTRPTFALHWDLSSQIHMLCLAAFLERSDHGEAGTTLQHVCDTLGIARGTCAGSKHHPLGSPEQFKAALRSVPPILEAQIQVDSLGLLLSYPVRSFPLPQSSEAAAPSLCRMHHRHTGLPVPVQIVLPAN